MTVPEHFKKKENLKKLSLLSTFKSFAKLFPVLCQPSINIAHNAPGHYWKIWPRVLTNHRERYIFTSSSNVIITQVLISVIDCFQTLTNVTRRLVKMEEHAKTNQEPTCASARMVTQDNTAKKVCYWFLWPVLR